MYKITLHNGQFNYLVSYKKNRKHIQIKFIKPELVEVTAPIGYPRSSIEQILKAKASWLTQQKEFLSSLSSSPHNQSVLPNSQVLFLGQLYSLTWVIEPVPNVEIRHKDKTIVLSLSEKNNNKQVAQAQYLLKNWYLLSAKEILLARTSFWAKEMNVQPKRLTLKDQKTRWGSCSSLGNVNYNWRIIMAPPETIDYLIIHELAHLTFLNHSKEFWLEVSRFSPNYQTCKNWLKTNGASLMQLFSSRG